MDGDVKAITAERGKVYGHPADHFARTVGILNAQGYRRLDPDTGEARELDALDWPAIMVSDKLARLCGTRDHEDSWDDVAGYSWTARRVLERRP